ncbi:MAG: ABC transporter ATP-binding protein [Candidatus Puniceispirillaceae bacterium]
MPDDGQAILVNRLTKTYAGSGKSAPKKALKAIDLAVPQGCIFGLLGPNGAGKSTFINILAGTVVKSAGSVRIWHSDLDDNPRQCRANIGVVPQELNIDAFFTPRELLNYTAGMYGVPKAERQIDEVLEMVDLTAKQHAYARTLSGGMRRRLLVAKAMMHSPPVLILDEPTAGVDVELRQRLWDNIKSLNAAGVTIMLTTHYLEEAEALCDHIAIINHGEVVTSQPKDQLMQSAGQKDLHVQITSPADVLPDSLMGYAPVISDGRLTIRFNPKETEAGQILQAISAAGLSIGDVSTDEPDLEDIFLSLTQSHNGQIDN